MKDQINCIPSFVQIMTCRQPGDKPLSEQMMPGKFTNIYASLGLNKLHMILTVQV